MLAITGANGFVGRALVGAALAADQPVRALVRSLDGCALRPVAGLEVRATGDLAALAPEAGLLAGCSAVIHCAGRAHRMHEAPGAALAAYRAVNCDGTRAVLAAMRAAGVRRLVHVSSIKACAERSAPGAALGPGQPPCPEDAYGVSKLESERLVAQAGAEGGIEPVVVRPVLVHGAEARGNLAALLAAIAGRRLLPLGAARNRRSLLGIANLCSALLVAARHPAATGRTYHLADAGAIGTRRLVEVLAAGLGIAPRLVGVPPWAVLAAASLAGRRATARRLFEDLVVDAGAFTADTGWAPAVGLEDGLARMADAWRQRGGR